MSIPSDEELEARRKQVNRQHRKFLKEHREHQAKHCIYVWKGYGEVHFVDACKRKRQILKEDGTIHNLPIPEDENAFTWMDFYYDGNGYKRMRLMEQADEYQQGDAFSGTF